MDSGIANILHRRTIAVIAGARTFERGERCFAAGRVEECVAARGELRGVVRPTDDARAWYRTRLWARADGLAYECTCPVGLERKLCKHTVAIALAHLERERREAIDDVELLRQALAAVPPAALVDGLVAWAARDAEVSVELRRLCLEALARR